MKADIYEPCATTKKNARIWADRKLHGIKKGLLDIGDARLINDCLIDAISWLTLNDMPGDVNQAIESLQIDLEAIHRITELNLKELYNNNGPNH